MRNAPLSMRMKDPTQTIGTQQTNANFSGSINPQETGSSAQEGVWLWGLGAGSRRGSDSAGRGALPLVRGARGGGGRECKQAERGKVDRPAVSGQYDSRTRPHASPIRPLRYSCISVEFYVTRVDRTCLGFRFAFDMTIFRFYYLSTTHQYDFIYAYIDLYQPKHIPNTGSVLDILGDAMGVLLAGNASRQSCFSPRGRCGCREP